MEDRIGGGGPPGEGEQRLMINRLLGFLRLQCRGVREFGDGVEDVYGCSST